MDNSSLTTLESMNQAFWYNRWTLGKFAKYLHGDIVEVGCGIGNFTSSLSRYGRVFAFDVDRQAVMQTKKRVMGNASIGLGDIEKGTYFFKNKTFSTVVCLNVLEHVADDTRALRNMWRLLAPGGFLILLSPIHPFLFGKIDRAIGHYRRYQPAAFVRQVKRQGFNIYWKRNLNVFGAIGWFIAGKILRRTSINSRFIRMFNFFSPFLLPLEDIISPPFGTSLLLIAQK